LAWFLPKLQRTLDRVPNEPDRGEVGLIGARGAQHIDHFFLHVDVRHRHEPYFVRVGVRRLEAAPKRRLVLDDVGDVNTDGVSASEGRVERIDRGGAEHDFPPAVRLSVDAARRFGVRHVRHRDFHPRALHVERRGAGAEGAVQGRHDQRPSLMA
jgi:hypothetical protein